MLDLAFEAVGGCVGDATGDQLVEPLDLAALAPDFGRADCNGGCPGDVNGDGDVDGRDVLEVALDFGRGDCP